MKTLNIWLSLAFLFICLNTSGQIMMSGDTFEKRADNMIQYMVAAHKPSGGDPKYTGHYYFARLYLNKETDRAITQLEAMYDKYIADPDLYYNSSGSGVEFYAHATLHGYLLTKDRMPESLKAKIKTFIQLGDYNSRGITLNLDMMRYTVGFLATEQWPDFTDRYGRSTEKIRDYNRPRILNWLDKFFHINCSEADAFIYLSTNLMYVRMLAEYAVDEEINRKANSVYQQMIAGLLSAWNKGIYVANPPRCKGWSQLYTGPYASDSNITALCWMLFGNSNSNKYQFVPSLTVTANTASANFWVAYKRNISPNPALFKIDKEKVFPYIYTSYIDDIGVDGSNKDTKKWKRFKYTYQSESYGLATQTEIPYNLSNAASTYAYKETKRTYLAWHSEVEQSVFSVCQDNPERPTDNVNANAVGYGENPHHRVMQHNRTAIGVYNVPTNYIQGKRYRIYVPFSKLGIKNRIESDGWVFCHTGSMLFAFKTLEPYTWQSTIFDVTNHDVLTLQDTECRKGSWILETSEITPQFQANTRDEELELFKNAILANTSEETVDYDGNTPTLRYTSLDGDVLELKYFPPTSAYNNNYKVNGTPLVLSEEYLFNSPYVKQKTNTDEVILYNANGEIEDRIIWNKMGTGITEENKKENTYSIYPNPVNNILNISLPNDKREFQITIFNDNGQMLKCFSVSGNQDSITYPVSNLSAGLYFVRITNDEDSYSFKFLKNRN